MTCLEHILAHTDTVVLVHRQKHLRSRDHPAIGDPFVWLDDPRGPPEPLEEPGEMSDAYVAAVDTPEPPSDRGRRRIWPRRGMKILTSGVARHGTVAATQVAGERASECPPSRG
jgi:hypothetical protein